MLGNILQKLGKMGKQPVLMLAVFIVLVGFIGAALSWSAPNLVKQASRPLTGASLKVTTSDGFDQSQAINPQTPAQTNGDASSSSSSPSSAPSPVPTPPPYVEPPPTYPPCNSCTPQAGHACPLYQVYPCTPCNITPRSDMACEVPEY